MFKKLREKYFTKEKILAGLKETWDTIVFVVVMVVIIRFFIGEIRWIPSGSMHPTLIEKDRVFINRMSRFYSTPNRGDIMVFYPPAEQLKNDPWSIFARLTGFFCKDIAYIKRVIGLPNDKIEIKKIDGSRYRVFVNDKELQEDYILDDTDYTPCTENMYCGPFVVPEGNYFMMGDNRGNSQDSRFWGTLPQERFIGKAKLLFWPITRIHYFTKLDYP